VSGCGVARAARGVVVVEVAGLRVETACLVVEQASFSVGEEIPSVEAPSRKVEGRIPAVEQASFVVEAPCLVVERVNVSVERGWRLVGAANSSVGQALLARRASAKGLGGGGFPVSGGVPGGWRAVGMRWHRRCYAVGLAGAPQLKRSRTARGWLYHQQTRQGLVSAWMRHGPWIIER
jgi:hypothetical protein